MYLRIAIPFYGKSSVILTLAYGLSRNPCSIKGHLFSKVFELMEANIILYVFADLEQPPTYDELLENTTTPTDLVQQHDNVTALSVRVEEEERLQVAEPPSYDSTVNTQAVPAGLQ